MKTQQYLTFSLDNWQYGIEATLVQEVLTLPELKPLALATNMIGTVNLRGQIVPILHLNLLQESPVKQFNLNDHIIIIQCQGLQLGIIINQVKEVLNLNPEEIQTKSFLAVSEINTSLISGFYQVDDSEIILLEPQTLISQLDEVLPLIWDAQMQLDLVDSSDDQVEQSDCKTSLSFLESPSLLFEENSQEEILNKQQNEETQTSEISSNFYDLYCPNTTPEERAIFRQRANRLKLLIETNLASKLIPLVIITLDNQYFALDLDLVRAFIDINNLTPIPCCPSHIIGNMNLRGEIITLVDIRKALNIPTSTIKIGSKAVLVQVDDVVAALPVERVLDMVELNYIDLSPLPTNSTNVTQHYLQSTTLFQGKTLNILDLPKLFKQGGITMNEEV
ncbi:MAG: chemotaxis protein CheW [Coleofasciculaceae cyanobacterium]